MCVCAYVCACTCVCIRIHTLMFLHQFPYTVEVLNIQDDGSAVPSCNNILVIVGISKNPVELSETLNALF